MNKRLTLDNLSYFLMKLQKLFCPNIIAEEQLKNVRMKDEKIELSDLSESAINGIVDRVIKKLENSRPSGYSHEEIDSLFDGLFNQEDCSENGSK